MSYDYFAATLKCLECGEVSHADTSTNMQTYLQDPGSHSVLRVGASLALEPSRVCHSEYDGYFYSGAALTNTIRILQSWECPACGSAPNWAQIEVVDGQIARIESVVFDRRSVFSSHLISNDAKSVAALLADISVKEAYATNVMEIFDKRL